MEGSSISLLKGALSQAGIILNAAQLEALNAFGDFLVNKNAQFNLTSIRDETGIVVRHFLDSLSPAIYVRELAALYSAGNPESKDLVDVGSGAGFPGIPLKILFGDALNVTLIDSTLKKVNFMTEAAGLLRLNGCRAVHTRADEAAGRAGMRGRFNYATARAVAALPKLIEYCLPLLAPGGILIAMKGRRAAAEGELAQSGPQLAKYGGRLVDIIGFSLDSRAGFGPPPDIGSANGSSAAVRSNPDATKYERTLMIIRNG